MLLKADMGKTMKAEFIDKDKDRTKFGYLPAMVTTSKGSIGSLMPVAASFCERVNSAANICVTKGNTLLSDIEVDMVVVLRMNREFMKFMRLNYPNASRQKFNMAAISDLDQ